MVQLEIKKTCTACDKEKITTEFYKYSKGKFGVKAICKLCSIASVIAWQKKNKTHRKEYMAIYAKANMIRLKEYGKFNYQNNAVQIKNKSKLYRVANPDKLLSRNRKYRDENRNKVREYHREWQKRKRIEDPMFKFISGIRHLTNQAFKRRKYKKSTKTFCILGAESEIVFNHIQSLFVKGMSWENYGQWHIDHKVPLCSSENYSDVLRLSHYSNLQPLWKLDNLKKGKKTCDL